MDQKLNESYAWCWSLCKQSQSSFFRSFYLLKRPRRQAMSALYAFSRISDDLSDGPDLDGTTAISDAANAKELLLQWRAQTCSLQNPQQLSSAPALAEYDPLWPALRDAIQRFDIPISLLLEIVDGVSVDQHQDRMQDWNELNAYCYQVASAVGLACAQIWKVREVPPKPAINCGIAFQLTNILRDIGEDARRGRIYIPKNVLREFEIDEQAWIACNPPPGWKNVVQHLADQALQLYDHGWSTIDALSPDSQRMFSLIWRSYRELLLEVLRNLDTLWSPDKVRLPFLTKTKLAAFHFLPPLFATLKNPTGSVASVRIPG